MSFTSMPFTPSGRIDVLSHFRVEVDNSGIRSPRPTQVHRLRYARVGGELAIAEDEAGIFVNIVLPLRSNEALSMNRTMNLAMIEDRLTITEDEVHIPRDIAVRE